MKNNKIGVVFAREYLIRVKKKSFIIMTLVTPILFAALMIVPSLIMIFGGDNEQTTVKVADESGIVMPYLQSSDKIAFEAIDIRELYSMKEDFKSLETDAVVKIAPMDSTKRLSIAVYSEKQMNMDFMSTVEEMAEDALRDYKIKSYNIDGLDEILAQVKPVVNVNSYLIDEMGEEKESHVEVAMAIGYIASFLIYMFIFMFGSMVMRSVIEEKTTRIVEVIISSVKPFQLMMGKILGVAAVGLTQFVIWIVATLLIVTVASSVLGSGKVAEVAAAQSELQMGAVRDMIPADAIDAMPEGVLSESPEQQTDIMGKIGDILGSVNFSQIIFCFLIYFLLGYLLYSGLFAAVGSAVDNEADTQQLLLPVTIPLIIGLFIMLHTFQYPDSSLSFWGSIIPFTSPMVMMARIAYGVAAWELVLSIALLVLTFLLLTYLSGKIYRVGILMYGKKASFKDIFKWIKSNN